MISFYEYIRLLSEKKVVPNLDQERMLDFKPIKLLPKDFKYNPDKIDKSINKVPGGTIDGGVFKPNKTLNISRSEMPQLKSREDFIRWIISLGTKVEVINLRPSKLVDFNGMKPTGFAQSEIYLDKAKRMIEKNNLLSKLIILSKENIIFDGNHHWLALMTAIESGLIKDQPVPMYKVYMPFDDLKKVTNLMYPGVTFEK